VFFFIIILFLLDESEKPHYYVIYKALAERRKKSVTCILHPRTKKKKAEQVTYIFRPRPTANLLPITSHIKYLCIAFFFKGDAFPPLPDSTLAESRVGWKAPMVHTLPEGHARQFEIRISFTSFYSVCLSRVRRRM
jgi:hypothetical protein